jgi:hypothetical protein
MEMAVWLCVLMIPVLILTEGEVFLNIFLLHCCAFRDPVPYSLLKNNITSDSIFFCIYVQPQLFKGTRRSGWFLVETEGNFT